MCGLKKSFLFISDLAVPLPSQSIWGGAAFSLQLSWEQSAQSHFSAFCFCQPAAPAGRSGGAFVTGEPLIKFPLHPWPAAGARWYCWCRGGLSDSWHCAALLFLRLKHFWCPWDFGLWALEPGITGHHLLMMSLPPRQDVEWKLCDPGTSQCDKSFFYAV